MKLIAGKIMTLSSGNQMLQTQKALIEAALSPLKKVMTIPLNLILIQRFIFDYCYYHI